MMAIRSWLAKLSNCRNRANPKGVGKSVEDMAKEAIKVDPKVVIEPTPKGSVRGLVSWASDWLAF